MSVWKARVVAVAGALALTLSSRVALGDCYPVSDFSYVSNYGDCGELDYTLKVSSFSEEESDIVGDAQVWGVCTLAYVDCSGYQHDQSVYSGYLELHQTPGYSTDEVFGEWYVHNKTVSYTSCPGAGNRQIETLGEYITTTGSFDYWCGE